MIKYLKFIVLFLAFLIFILFSFTMFVIIKKYNEDEYKVVENSDIIPKLDNNHIIQSFEISDEKLYIHILDNISNKNFIAIYRLKDGRKVGNISLD